MIKCHGRGRPGVIRPKCLVCNPRDENFTAELPSVKSLAPPEQEEEVFRKTQMRRRHKKHKHGAAIGLLQAQFAAATATSASAVVASNIINKNFSVKSAVPGAFDDASASTRKKPSNSLTKPSIFMPSNTSIWITVASKSKRPQFKRRMSKPRGVKRTVTIERF